VTRHRGHHGQLHHHGHLFGSVASIATELSSQEFTNGTGPTTRGRRRKRQFGQHHLVDHHQIPEPHAYRFGGALRRLCASGRHRLGRLHCGFTYDLTPTNGDVYLYNPNVSAASAPTATQSPSGVSLAVGAMIKATVPSAGQQ